MMLACCRLYDHPWTKSSSLGPPRAGGSWLLPAWKPNLPHPEVERDSLSPSLLSLGLLPAAALVPGSSGSCRISCVQP